MRERRPSHHSWTDIGTNVIIERVPRIDVDPSAVAAAGAAIGALAAQTAPLRVAADRLAEVDEPRQTADALGDLRTRWALGMTTLATDLERLGEATLAASTRYTETDTTAMQAP